MVKTSALKKQLLLKHIQEEDLKKIAEKMQELSFKKDSYIFKENSEAKGIYLIHSGILEISKTTADGWTQTLAALGPGHFCGELSILEKRRHEANALVIEDAVVFLLSKEEFEKMEVEDVCLANVILKTLATALSKNLRRMNEKLLTLLINY